ncbi:hypothetical protein B0A48_18338 [Cryoendolithus antarcticus]|uniref:C2H2-type domain-containing protein n=1 Tax=Cryoendolithus antarcticus TaxID=1507870 RepID=A0A1V8SAD4_9PEZI|nr:hypothetical protein B0A48_18338 [Cryoendolithus antarcticus]
MTEHMKSHEGDTPYVCHKQTHKAKRGRCRSRFATAGGLSAHVSLFHLADSAKDRDEITIVECGPVNEADMFFGRTFNDLESQEIANVEHGTVDESNTAFAGRSHEPMEITFEEFSVPVVTLNASLADFTSNWKPMQTTKGVVATR